jgi:hypothetical protein
MALRRFRRTVYTSGAGKTWARRVYMTRQPIHELGDTLL